jgi:hypothetical protein
VTFTVTDAVPIHARYPFATRGRSMAQPRELGQDRVAGVLLLVLGVLTLAAGIYFWALRPPMLAEDERFTGVAVDALPPRMAEWLSIVFHTLGGFITGFAIIILGSAIYLMTRRGTALRWSLALALVVAFGRFLVGNTALGSHFLPFVTTVAVLALIAAWRLTVRV